MKFEKHDLTEGMKLPAAAMQLAGFGAHEAAEYHTLKNTVVILKKRMNALELIQAVWSLEELMTELCAHLLEVCRLCDGCESCGGAEEDCPYDELSYAAEVELPEELLERADIPQDAPLHVELEEGKIILSVNRDGPNLWDVPAPLMRSFIRMGMCPACLEAMLETGAVVYDS